MGTSEVNAIEGGADYLVVAVSGALFILGLFANAALANRVYLNRAQWQRGIDKLVWRPWSLSHLSTILALLVLLSVVFGGATQFLLGLLAGEDKLDQPIQLVITGLVIQLATIVLIIGVLVYRRMTWSAAFDHPTHRAPQKLGTSIIYYLAVMPLVVLCAAASHAILNGIGVEPETQELFKDISKSMTPGMMVGSFILAAVGAPITEELLFRGIALPVTAKYIGTFPAVILVSLVFAIIHMNLASTLPLFVLAIGMSLAYIYSQSILVPIVMHACFNAINLLMFFLLQQEGLFEALLR